MAPAGQHQSAANQHNHLQHASILSGIAGENQSAPNGRSSGDAHPVPQWHLNLAVTTAG
jgi:hypothetical protein